MKAIEFPFNLSLALRRRMDIYVTVNMYTQTHIKVEPVEPITTPFST